MNEDTFALVIEDWARERPDLSTWPIAIIGRLHLLGRLVDGFYESSFAPFGLRSGDFFVLSELRRAGSPYRLTPTDLCRVLVRSSGGMTKQLDQLESAGWIVRERDANDRRSLWVRLTETGSTLIDSALTEHIENEQRLLAYLSESDKDEIPAQLASLVRALRDFGDEPARRKR